MGTIYRYRASLYKLTNDRLPSEPGENHTFWKRSAVRIEDPQESTRICLRMDCAVGEQGTHFHKGRFRDIFTENLGARLSAIIRGPKMRVGHGRFVRGKGQVRNCIYLHCICIDDPIHWIPPYKRRCVQGSGLFQAWRCRSSRYFLRLKNKHVNCGIESARHQQASSVKKQSTLRQDCRIITFSCAFLLE